MIRDEWLSATDPPTLLRLAKPRGDLRLKRLFVVACCRRTWDLLVESESCRVAVEVGERFADGAATAEELEDARDACVHFAGSFLYSQAPSVACDADIDKHWLEVPGMIGAALAYLEEREMP